MTTSSSSADIDRVLRDANLPDLHKNIEELEMRRLLEMDAARTRPAPSTTGALLGGAAEPTAAEAKREANRLLIEHFAYVTNLSYIKQ